ncbi:hypothetical protein [Geoalkalibacter halelectricus]|uniref:hypothetical protein n=1 Tax=Geoalkalibacter halelectricus TaxID=2847045 RepID=UPI00266ECB6E|nr:hypothetical protein [Geoalkalibacter halelectricus]MDO3378513.1 hypothetical protein [Geoalkalibacter halelectricus]
MLLAVGAPTERIVLGTLPAGLAIQHTKNPRHIHVTASAHLLPRLVQSDQSVRIIGGQQVRLSSIGQGNIAADTMRIVAIEAGL